MLKFNICIPSKGRAGLMTSHKIFKSAIIYVPESEITQYSIYKNKIIGVPSNIKGITQTRNWILKNNKCDVFFLDDDLDYAGIIERKLEKYKVRRISDEIIYLDQISKLFEIAYQFDAKLIGLFTSGNNLTNYPYAPFVFNGACLGSCMGIINDGTYYFNEEYEVKEDYELTLRNIKDGRPVVRTSVLFMQHEHTQMKGGCRDSNRINKEKKAIKLLIKEYPGMIKSAKHRGTSFAIQFNI